MLEKVLISEALSFLAPSRWKDLTEGQPESENDEGLQEAEENTLEKTLLPSSLSTELVTDSTPDASKPATDVPQKHESEKSGGQVTLVSSHHEGVDKSHAVNDKEIKEAVIPQTESHSSTAPSLSSSTKLNGVSIIEPLKSRQSSLSNIISTKIGI